MYEPHWQLQRSPFGHDHRPESFFAGGSHHDGLLKLKYLIEQRRGFGVLVGANGSGKTRLLDAVLQPAVETNTPVARIVYPQMSAGELLRYIVSKLDGAGGNSTGEPLDAILGRLEHSLRTLTADQRPPIIVIDDAHVIEDRHVLQALQLLLNFQQAEDLEFTLILAGQPELVGIVRRLPQLDDRIAIPCVLQALTPTETADYIRHRLRAAGAMQPIFLPAALESIHQLSGGLPRRINRLCDFALLVGYAEDLSAIDAEQIEGVHVEMSLARAA